MDRHEIKFILSKNQKAVLQSRLSAVMEKDSHSEKDGTYTVRSLYFDTYDLSCYNDSVSGVGIRKKYRLRTYNNDITLINREIKEREYNVTRKLTQTVDTSTVENILSGSTGFNGIPLLQPVCICEYKREAYVSEPFDLRITFDTNITASFECEKFLSDDYFGIPIMPDEMILMEIKYTDFIPDYVMKILNIGEMDRSSFSKYCKSIDTIKAFTR